MRSLGNDIQSISLTEGGFNIHYCGGDQCFYKKNAYNFTSEVRFICDHEEEEGWPVQMNSDLDEENEPCHVIFEWRTKQACR
jgi:hypothetical protein